WAAFVPGTEPAEGVLVPRSALPGAASALPGDVVLVRGRDVPAGAPVLGWYQMVAGDRSVPARYMLIEGVVEGDEEAERFFVRTPSGYALSVDGRLYPAVGLDPSLIETLRQPDLTAVARIAWIYLGLVLLTFALSYAQVYILHYTGQRIVYNIRQQIYSHLQRMPIRFFD